MLGGGRNLSPPEKQALRTSQRLEVKIATHLSLGAFVHRVVKVSSIPVRKKRLALHACNQKSDHTL
jgi:hypothetical protein